MRRARDAHERERARARALPLGGENGLSLARAAARACTRSGPKLSTAASRFFLPTQHHGQARSEYTSTLIVGLGADGNSDMASARAAASVQSRRAVEEAVPAMAPLRSVCLCLHTLDGFRGPAFRVHSGCRRRAEILQLPPRSCSASRERSRASVEETRV